MQIEVIEEGKHGLIAPQGGQVNHKTDKKFILEDVSKLGSVFINKFRSTVSTEGAKHKFIRLVCVNLIGFYGSDRNCLEGVIDLLGSLLMKSLIFNFSRDPGISIIAVGHLHLTNQYALTRNI